MQGGYVFGVFYTRTDDAGEAAEEMGTGGGELIATDKPTVMAKPPLDPIVVENGQGNRSLADSTSTNESDWNKLFGEIDYLLDQLVASKERP